MERAPQRAPMASYLSSILFNWGGKIDHGQRTTARQDLPHISDFMHVLHERYILK